MAVNNNETLRRMNLQANWTKVGLGGIQKAADNLQQGLSYWTALAARAPGWEDEGTRQRAIFLAEQRRQIDSQPLLSKADHQRLADSKVQFHTEVPSFLQTKIQPLPEMPQPVVSNWEKGLDEIEVGWKKTYQNLVEDEGIALYKEEKAQIALRKPHPLRSALGRIKGRIEETANKFKAGIGNNMPQIEIDKRKLGVTLAGTALAGTAATLVAALVFGRPANNSDAQSADCKSGDYVYNDDTLKPRLVNGTFVAGATPVTDCVGMTATAESQVAQFIPNPNIALPSTLGAKATPTPFITSTPIPTVTSALRSPDSTTRAYEMQTAVARVTTTAEVQVAATVAPTKILIPFVETSVSPKPTVTITETPKPTSIPEKPAVPTQTLTPESTPKPTVNPVLEEFLNQQDEITDENPTAEQAMQVPGIVEDWKQSFVKEYWRLIAQSHMKEGGKDPNIVKIGYVFSPKDYMEEADYPKMEEALLVTSRREAFLLETR